MKKNRMYISDAIPQRPASFDETVERMLALVCQNSQKEEKKEKQEKPVTRSWTVENGKERKRGAGSIIKRIGIGAVVAVFVVCTVGVSVMIALRSRSGITSPTPAADAPQAAAMSQKTEIMLLPDYVDPKTGEDYNDYAALRRQNGVPAFSEAEFSWLKELNTSVNYLDLNSGTLDCETAFEVPQSLRDALQNSPINGDDQLVSIHTGEPAFFLDGSELDHSDDLLESYGAQCFYSSTFALQDSDPWKLDIAQQFVFRNGSIESLKEHRTLTVRLIYSVYDCRYLDLTIEDWKDSTLNMKCALVGVIRQTVEIDLQTLMQIDAEYRTEITLSGMHTLTCIKQESNGEYSYSNKELNFDGLVLNETVQYRPTGLYVTLSVKDLPQEWEKSYGTSLLYPSTFVAENMYGLSAELTWGVGERQMKMLPVGSRVPWACPKDTIVFVFPVTASDSRLSHYGAEMHFYLRATGEKNAQELCRVALPVPENGGQNAATPNPTPVPTPEPTAEPVVTEEPTPEPGAIPSVFRFWEYDEQNGYSEAPEKGVLFTCDFDGNGTEDEIAYERHGQYLTISVGKKSVELSYGAGLEQAILMDLDPASERLNLLVVYNTGSEDYETAELHMENGKFVRGPVIYAYCTCDGGTVHGSVTQTDILGTRYGARNYHGEDLTPDSEWFDCDVIPDEIQSASDREHLIEWGKLLHLVRDLPCTIDGQDAVIPAGTYVYMTRWHESGTLAEIRTEDGTLTALVTVEGADPDDPEQYGYLIGGELQDTYFDNIFYAD